MNNDTLLRASFFSICITLAALLALHVLSPEFDPSWRMVSEYALGQFNAVLMLFFFTWAVGSWLLAWCLWPRVTGIPATIGVLIIVLFGISAILGGLFDVRQQTMHGVAFALSFPFPIAALLVGAHLARRAEYAPHKKLLLWTSQLPWVSIVLMIASVIVMMRGFAQAGIPMGTVPETVPPTVIALAGYANRLMIVVYCAWLLVVGRVLRKTQA